ncbi:hypothetical protein CY35_15G081500 [Sphagnum magellanicum]|nr:hypothetical protein CY35_15G081500 [Sphagnum magellanicum]
MGEKEMKKVVVVGGSIAGLSCAHAFLKAKGWEVVVLEKARSVSSAGAGLGLDPEACDALKDWGIGDGLLQQSLPLSIEENRAIDSNRQAHIVARDESYDHRAVHWSDLHRLLYNALPAGIVQLGHEVISYEEESGVGPDKEPQVKVRVKKVTGSDDENNIQEYTGDLMVAADGSMSQTREKNFPGEKRRYSGYCAWRGVLDGSTERNAAAMVRRVYPDLGQCLYFDIAQGTHSVLYELPGGRLNWLWYINQPEPQLKGKSVTVKADEKALAALHEQASKTWVPELATLMQATTDPFINAIFDREPLSKFVWGRVVLVGEAAHPTTPHGLRSTNMSIVDAYTLGNAIQNRRLQGIDAALQEYESRRVLVTAQQVLFSRHLGQLKQGLLLPEKFSWISADQKIRSGLLQQNMHSF